MCFSLIVVVRSFFLSFALQSCKLSFDENLLSLSSTAGNIHITLQWRSAEVKEKKFLVHNKDMKSVCCLCLLTLLIPVSSSFQCIVLTGMWLLTETTIASLILISGQLGGLYSCSPVGNSFLKTTLLCWIAYCTRVNQPEVKPVATVRDIAFVSSPIATSWPALLGTIIRKDLFG